MSSESPARLLWLKQKKTVQTWRQGAACQGPGGKLQPSSITLCKVFLDDFVDSQCLIASNLSKCQIPWPESVLIEFKM